jgi:hypothetical protein
MLPSSLLGGDPGRPLRAVLAGVALLALALPAGAQSHTMHFRPMPAESVSGYQPRDRAASRDREAARDTADLGTTPQIPPEPPEAPEPPHAHSTSSDIVRFGSDVTIAHDQVVEGDVVSFGGAI